MDATKFKNILAIGENTSIEFKVTRTAPKEDTFETVCSFLNRFGGDIFLGVEDNSEVFGIPKGAVEGYIKNITNTCGNPEFISPTVQISPASFVYDGKHIIHIHVPASSEVHTCKKVIYDRIGDADVKITSTSAIAAMYIRKQEIFTERKVYPFVKISDLRFDLFPRIKRLAARFDPNHPWQKMSDMEILRSAKLIDIDPETGREGYNLAAVVLLGKDEIIKSVVPTHRTDAILRKVNVDRYDDRLIVETNLIESYDLLMGFAEKHLWDKFYLEGTQRISLRANIAREMLVNTLMHREFKTSHFAQFVIEKDRMYIENANRAIKEGEITPDTFKPVSKNPIIAAFFRTIGFADELGSGVRNLYKYTKLYSGKNPQLIEGDIFKIIVPLDDSYSFDAMLGQDSNRQNVLDNVQNVLDNVLEKLTKSEKKILALLKGSGKLTNEELATKVGVDERTVRRALKKLKDHSIIERIGSDRDGEWKVFPH